MLKQIHQGEQDTHVSRNLLAHSGAENLDNHLASVMQPRRVDLGYRSRSQRVPLKTGKDRFGVRSQCLFDDPYCFVGRERSGLALQLREARGPVRIQQIAPLAQRLSELGEGRAEIFETPRRPLWKRGHAPTEPHPIQHHCAQHIQ